MRTAVGHAHPGAEREPRGAGRGLLMEGAAGAGVSSLPGAPGPGSCAQGVGPDGEARRDDIVRTILEICVFFVPLLFYISLLVPWLRRPIEKVRKKGKVRKKNHTSIKPLITINRNPSVGSIKQ